MESVENDFSFVQELALAANLLVVYYNPRIGKRKININLTLQQFQYCFFKINYLTLLNHLITL